MLNAGMIIAILSGGALIASVLFQTTTAEGFSASLGGRETSRFQKGSRDELLEKVCKVAAVVWVLSMLFVASVWFKSQ
ncbi:MAG: preprotein translocase subunit SecG [Armatimonadetes bacterium]|nr:preprotein translocase subunit SecG [Armatimonadota bacterium]